MSMHQHPLAAATEEQKRMQEQFRHAERTNRLVERAWTLFTHRALAPGATAEKAMEFVREAMPVWEEYEDAHRIDLDIPPFYYPGSRFVVPPPQPPPKAD